MARDRANIRVDMWADEDWRKLSMGAQHLYQLILTHASLSYAGVGDWRPARLAALTRDRTAADVRRDGAELQAAAFVYVDEETEEIVVRSFIRHDGLLKHPRLPVSMANDYAAIASETIRAGVAYEVQKLAVEQPELGAWSKRQVQTILKAKARSLKELCGSYTNAMAKAMPKDSNVIPMHTEPKGMPNAMPSDPQSTDMHTATATTTTTKSTPRRAYPEPIPDGWEPHMADVQWAIREGGSTFPVKRHSDDFCDWYRGKGDKKADWNAVWRVWMRDKIDRHRADQAKLPGGVGMTKAELEAALSAPLTFKGKKVDEPA
jgi:hypothetical protein